MHQHPPGNRVDSRASERLAFTKAMLNITKTVVPLLMLFCLLACSEGFKLVRVVDGDTIVVRRRLATENVRLIGVDAPEMENPDKGRLAPEPYAHESRQCLVELLDAATLRLQFDTPSGAPERDKYGRLLAYVFQGDENVNLELVRRGCARAYKRFPHSKMGRFIRLEKLAKKRQVGIWSKD